MRAASFRINDNFVCVKPFTSFLGFGPRKDFGKNLWSGFSAVILRSSGMENVYDAQKTEASREHDATVHE